MLSTRHNLLELRALQKNPNPNIAKMLGAFFITALLPTAKIQESQFAYLPTYKIAKTALKEIVL